VKIETFLKGDTMKLEFNPAQLSRTQQNSLMDVLGVMQNENQNELVVTPVEFPIKLKVKLDDDIELLLCWDAGKQSYAGLTKPEPKPESQKDTVDLPKQEPDLKSAGELIESENEELIKAEIGKRVQALAQALVKLSKPLNTFQRGEVWIEFSRIYIKELYE